MGKTRHGRLVRDRIPDAIRSAGKIPNTRTMDTDEFRRELLYKLIDEAEQLRKENYIEHKERFLHAFVAVSTVLEEVQKEFGLSDAEVVEEYRTQQKERGGFEKRVFLDSVHE